MRIIAGRFRGMRLPSPKGRRVRPTADRVREAIFSTLGELVEGAWVLDLFAGTGAFGLEALSRGAASVVLVERDRQVSCVIAETVRVLGIENEVRILNIDALEALRLLHKQGTKFTVIFLDPPYESEWIPKIASDAILPNLLESEGVFIVEKGVHSPKTGPPPIFGKRFSRKYGGTEVEIFHLV
jgi:16S rRNA (guanine966-N2)-methyltransferase